MIAAPSRLPTAGRAFSLVELVVVVAILGTIVAIAISQMSSAASNSATANLRANVTVLERAIAHYVAEHDDRTPAHEVDGKVSVDEPTFVKRLTTTSNAAGDTGDKLLFGPYLRDIPGNPINASRRIRVDGAPAGANTHGWRFDSATRIIEPDDIVQGAVIRASGGGVAAAANSPKTLGDAPVAAGDPPAN